MKLILGRKKNTTELDYRMELLLGLKGFRIQQIDNIRAKMPVGIGYTLIIDITQKPAAWEIQFRDPDNQENYIYTPYCEFKEPEKAHKNATELITAYQMALVDRVMGIEGMPVIKPPKSRARSKQAQAVEDPLPEEPVLEEMAEAMDEEPEVKAEEPEVHAEEPKVKEEILPGPKISPSAAEKFYLNALKDIESSKDTKINNEDILAALQAEDPMRSVAEALGLIRTEEERGQPEEVLNQINPDDLAALAILAAGEALEKSSPADPEAQVEESIQAEESIQVQKPEPFPEQIIRNLSQDGIVITKNAKGAYQWEITARSDSLNTAIEKALLADKKLREELRGGA